jgi:hypothetical protein
METKRGREREKVVAEMVREIMQAEREGLVLSLVVLSGSVS